MDIAHWRPRLAGLAALAVSLAGASPRAAEIPPGHLVALDAFADPFSQAHFGATFDVDPSAAVESNASALASSASLYLASDLAFLPDRSLVIVDRDADPSGLGADANGDPGPGALFLAGPVDQGLRLLADGTDYPAGLPPPAQTAFVDPRGVAILPDGRILVADTDADPSALGSDTAGFAGHGALFVVSSTGSVALVSDGTLSADGPVPGARPSWLEDPGAVVVCRNGSIYLLDVFGDPLGLGARGAVYSVDLATGSLRLVATSAQLRAPVGIEEMADGDLVISDQLLDVRGDGSRGALLRVDLSAADPALAISVEATDPRFRGPSFMGAAPDGSLFVADGFADPLGLGRVGAIFRLRPDTGLELASASATFLALSSVRVAPPTAPAPTLASVSPGVVQAGDSVTLSLAGTGFVSGAEVRLGAGVTVSAVRVLSSLALEADISADLAASPGLRDAVVINPDLQAARLVGALEVQARTRPQPLSILPAAGIQGTSVNVRILGENFDPLASLNLGPGISVSGLSILDAGSLEADLLVDASAAPGPRDVIVTNPDLLSGSLVGGFEVLPPAPPNPISVTPPLLRIGESARLSVDGGSFAPGMTLTLGPGVSLGPVLVESPFRASVRVHVSAGASPGARDLLATNPDLQSGSLLAAAEVEDIPALRVVSLRVDDSGGNANGVLEPGERAGLDFLLRNISGVVGTSLTLRVSDPNPGTGLVVIRALVPFPDLAAGESARRPGAPFPEVEVDGAIACGSRLPLDVEILRAGAPIHRTRVGLVVGRVDSWARKPSLEGDAPGGRRGMGLALADIDGDGVADLVVGAPAESPAGIFSSGRVVAVSGATDDPLWTFPGNEVGGLLGSAIAPVGDVDGDGAVDLLVGAPGEGSQAGRVRVISGRSGLEIAQRVGSPGERFGSAVAWLGDRDLDGQDDALVAAPAAGGDAGRVVIVRLPSLDIIEQLAGLPGERLGSALAAPGDVDDDGRADAVAGAAEASGGAGRVVLWRSSLASLALSGAPGDRLGAALAADVDIDQDALRDIAAGAPGASGAGPMAGRVDLLSGATLSVIRSLPGEIAGDEFGSAVAFTADVDGDGLPEIAIGAPGASGSDGLVDLRSGADGRPMSFFEPSASDAGRLGERLASGPDAGGDGFGDLLVGEPRRGSAVPLAGRGLALKTLASCTPVIPCIADALEPSGVGMPVAADYGDVANLSICRDDIDAYILSPPLDRRMHVRIAFRHAAGDLDAVLLDGAGNIVDSSLSVDDDEELGPFGPGGTWEVRVSGFERATNSYALSVTDPDSCMPTLEVEALRVSRVGGRTLLSWAPSIDRCHAAPPEQGHVIWAAPSPRRSGPDPFPGGTSFTNVSGLDQDSDLTNERFVDDRGGSQCYLVADRGRAGEVGPAGMP